MEKEAGEKILMGKGGREWSRSPLKEPRPNYWDTVQEVTNAIRGPRAREQSKTELFTANSAMEGFLEKATNIPPPHKRWSRSGPVGEKW